MSLLNHQRLVTDETTLRRSLGALKFAVFTDSIIGLMLQPNYAIMVIKGAHEESFPSTYPFDFAAATYFIPMTAFLGVSIAALFTGAVSDHVGRRPVILFCLGGSTLGSAVKWLCRKSFFAFCAANFFNGLMSASLPVASAYISDVFESNEDKEKQFSSAVGYWVLGQSVGGIISILMFPQGLFAPLLVGVGIMFLAFLFNYQFLIEPGNLKIPAGMNDIHVINDNQKNEDEEEVEKEEGGVGKDENGEDSENKEFIPNESEAEIEDLPDEIDKTVMSIILFGVFADVFGSKALFPMCLAPLAFDNFYQDFVNNGELPILSLNGYQWLTVMVAVLVIPSAILTPRVFQKIGLALTCVIGNLVTGALTIALLYAANAQPPTSGSFTGFAVALYIGFPFTVLSQLSATPMLDRISPKNRRGFVQGAYTLMFNIASALSPWLLGLLADATSTDTMIWTGIGISFGAALINSPLIFVKILGPPKQKEKVITEELEDMTLSEEEERMWEEKASSGEYVPAEVLNTINLKRIQEEQPLLVPTVATYEQDKDRLDNLRSQAKKDFKFLTVRSQKFLSKINDPDMPQFVEKVDQAYMQSMGNTHDEIGRWFAEYLKDSGYVGPGSSQTLKIMIMKAFPVLVKGGRFTADNFEQALVNTDIVYNHYLGNEIRTEEYRDEGIDFGKAFIGKYE